MPPIGELLALPLASPTAERSPAGSAPRARPPSPSDLDRRGPTRPGARTPPTRTVGAWTALTIASLLTGAILAVPLSVAEVAYADVDLDELDITTMLPTADLAAARVAFNCDLDDGLCEMLFDHLVELPFGWHVTGYDLYFADRESVWESCSTSVASRGCVRTSAKQIHVAVGFAGIFDTEEFRQWTELYPVLRTLTHEVAHTLHASCAPFGIEDAKLLAYANARGLPPGIDVRGHDGGPYTSQAEDFAETAMLWLTRDHTLTYYSRSPYGEPDAEALEALALVYFGLCR